MSFTASDIKKLREITGAGMMACKEALVENNGDLTRATTFLRKKGLAAAEKKQSRIASEGRIASAVAGGKGVLVEVNCETDFVSRGDDFKEFAQSVATYALNENVDDLSALREAKSTEVNELTLKCGEKIEIRRLESLTLPNKGHIGEYNHSGRIGVLVGLETPSEVQSLARDLAMHIAAASPSFVGVDDIDENFKKREAEIYSAQLREQKKPEHMIEKIVQGKLRKLATEVCLLEQKFVKDQEKSVKKLLEENGDIKVLGFVKINLGEGLEIKKESFTEEVAKMTCQH